MGWGGVGWAGGWYVDSGGCAVEPPPRSILNCTQTPQVPGPDAVTRVAPLGQEPLHPAAREEGCVSVMVGLGLEVGFGRCVDARIPRNYHVKKHAMCTQTTDAANRAKLYLTGEEASDHRVRVGLWGVGGGTGRRIGGETARLMCISRSVRQSPVIDCLCRRCWQRTRAGRRRSAGAKGGTSAGAIFCRPRRCAWCGPWLCVGGYLGTGGGGGSGCTCVCWFALTDNHSSYMDATGGRDAAAVPAAPARRRPPRAPARQPRLGGG